MSEETTEVQEIPEIVVPKEERLVDPKAVEQEMVKRELGAPKDPVELAAMLYTLYLPQFHARLDKLSNKATKRVIRALIETPLITERFAHTSQEEKECFAIADRLLEAKNLMIMNTFAERAMKEINTEMNKEIVNGETEA